MNDETLQIERYLNDPETSTAIAVIDNNLPQFIGETRTDLIGTFYQGASNLVITEKEEQALIEPVNPDNVSIRPEGLIYLPQVFFRDKLNTTFGRGQWALIQHSISKTGNKLNYDGSLYIRGCFIARSMGEHEYRENNPLGSWASSYESAKSDCLTRCCKDLGIAKELWQPVFITDFIKKRAVKVYVTDKEGKKKVQFRLINSEPFWNECGYVDGKAPAKVETVKTEPKPEPAKPQEPVKNLITAPQLKKLNALGMLVYPDNWDESRHKLCLWVSGNKISSSKELTKEQADQIITGLEKKAGSSEAQKVAQIKAQIATIEDGITFIQLMDELTAKIAEVKDINVRKILQNDFKQKENQFTEKTK